MKKMITMLFAFALISTMSLSVFAEGSFLPAESTNQDNSINTEDPTISIPVYGYIGEDAELEDKNPTDPDEDISVNPTPTDMVISAPIKLIWAAFASEGGKITSPTYVIENKSAFEVSVELTSFRQIEGDNTALNDAISLEIARLSTATNIVGLSSMNNVVTLAAATKENDKITFEIGGNFSGNFGTTYKPKYEMILTFALAA